VRKRRSITHIDVAGVGDVLHTEVESAVHQLCQCADGVARRLKQIDDDSGI
jgi:hypothetical protein